MSVIITHFALSIIRSTSRTIRSKSVIREAIEHLAMKKHGMTSSSAEKIANQGSHLGWSSILCYRTLIWVGIFTIFAIITNIVAAVEGKIFTNPLFVFWLVIGIVGTVLSWLGIGHYYDKYEQYLKKELNINSDDVIDEIGKMTSQQTPSVSL